MSSFPLATATARQAPWRSGWAVGSAQAMDMHSRKGTNVVCCLPQGEGEAAGAPAAAATAPSSAAPGGVADMLGDPAYLASVLGSLPGVDPSDPALQGALASLGQNPGSEGQNPGSDGQGAHGEAEGASEKDGQGGS